jgi:hypothetical protein
MLARHILLRTWLSPDLHALAGTVCDDHLQPCYLVGSALALHMLTALLLLLACLGCPTAGSWRQHLLSDSVALALSSSAQQLRQLAIQTLEVTRDCNSSSSGLARWPAGAGGRQVRAATVELGAGSHSCKYASCYCCSQRESR